MSKNSYNNFRIVNMQGMNFLNNSSFGGDNSVVYSFFSKLDSTEDRDLYGKEIQNLDKELYKYFAAQNYATNDISRQLYEQPLKEAIKLDIPKMHSLADSMLRSTLGSQQKYAQKYLQIIDQTKKVEEDEKKKRIEQAKKKFAASNSHNSFIANSKPFMEKKKMADTRPVIDNQHDVYVKTHLTFLDRPNPISDNKQYSNRFTDCIAKKINQMGGIENTLTPIQSSLSTFEMRKNRKWEDNRSKSKTRKASPSPIQVLEKLDKRQQKPEPWLAKSKQMRQQLQAQLIS